MAEAVAEFVFEFVPVVPPDPEMIGFEAMIMAQKFTMFTPAEIGKITAPVLIGFEKNFEAEASPQTGPWSDLAKQTLRERIEEGFPYPQYPMLVRTGQYRASWIDREDPRHLEEYRYAGSGFLVSEAIIEVGSRHPHVEPLESGSREGTMGMFSDILSSGPLEELDFGDSFVDFGGEGFVPPRPVRFLADSDERAIGVAISVVLNDALEDLEI